MRLSIAAAIMLVPLGIAPAHASAIVLWPVDPTIKPGEQATALWIENKGDSAVTMQVRTYAWSQESDADRLAPQDAVVASPPIARVEPGRRQLVRIIRRRSGAAPETAYRLIVDELPAPRAIGAQAPQARLAVQMRYSVPLFTYNGAAETKPRLTTKLRTGAAGRELVLTNTGAGHARLTDLRIEAGARRTSVRTGLIGYVLAGSTIALPLPVAAGTITVAVNGVDQPLTPDA